MKFAIISAGEGSRLSQEGVALPKPLVQLNGTAMIDRLIQIFVRNGADKVVVIINNEVPLTKEHLLDLQQNSEIPLEVVIKTTPSSMHSFYELSKYLDDDKFCLTTVDTIFREDEFSKFIQYFKEMDADGCMAVTDYIDDEKPLYISTDNDLNITGFHDEATSDCKYISGGIYCLTPSAIRTLHACMEKGMARMRNFQRQLVADGLKLKAYPFKKIVDVDHAEDIVKAEAFLNEKE
jgi:NDP-sugar pyrophosphorylase family protein